MESGESTSIPEITNNPDIKEVYVLSGISFKGITDSFDSMADFQYHSISGLVIRFDELNDNIIKSSGENFPAPNKSGGKMFTSKPYWQINREERFYCFLFGHALLSSRQVRENFTQMAESKFSISMDPDNFEVYVEAAVLRDYWHDLGNPIEYSEKTHTNRREVLDAILKEYKLPGTTLEVFDLFWTTPNRTKLWSPSRWSIGTLQSNGLDNLIPVKWAFNSKPDIVIVSDSTVLLIEAKVESSEGRDGQSGYRQFEVQELVSKLMKLLIPEFQNMVFWNTSLEVKTEGGISWGEILEIIDRSDIDDFSKLCLSQLQKF